MNRFKKLCALCAALLVSIVSFAQSSLLATLSHEGNISSFYGPNALKEAYNAAVDDDVITLSSGQFNAVDIAKRLIIRGAGMDVFEDSYCDPTVIVGTCALNSGCNGLYLEGLNFQNEMRLSTIVANLTIIKCKILYVRLNGYNDYIQDGTFLHCCFVDGIKISNSADAGNAQFINCILGDAQNYFMCNCSLDNCLLTGKHCWYASYCSFKNCVVWTWDTTPSASDTNTFYNNLIVLHNGGSVWGVGSSNNVINRTEAEDVFEESLGGWGGKQYAKPKEGAFERFPGSDGLGVGIYGGSLPFDPIPTNPQITKFNVASKSTADGKLSVDITVAVPE